MSMIHVLELMILDDSLDPQSHHTELLLTVMQLFCNKVHA